MNERCELTELLTDQCAHCRNIPDPDAGGVRERKMSAASRAKSLALHVEDLMLIMNTSKLKREPGRVGGARYSLRYFDKAEPYDQVEITHADDPNSESFADATPWDLSSPLDVVIATRALEDPSLYGLGQNLFGQDFDVQRFRRVKRPYLPVDRQRRYMVEASQLAIDSRAGIARTTALFWGKDTPSSSWVEMNPLGYRTKGIWSDEAVRAQQDVLDMAVGLQFSQDYQWRVHLKFTGAEIGVMIPSTPGGIRSLFRLRDYEAGESRRKALIHWVTGHSRRIRKDTAEEDLVWVCDHLRGRMTFKWQDMQGAVYPSGHDMRRLQALKSGGAS